MDKQQTKQIADASKAALEAVAAEFGVAIEYKGGSYDSGSCIIKFEFADIGEGGIVKTREATDFQRHATSYGLEASDLGREFTSNSHTFTITGLKTRARKMPIMATKNADGRNYKFSADRIATLLGRKGMYPGGPAAIVPFEDKS